MRFYTLLGDLEVSAIFSDLVDEFLPIYPTVPRTGGWFWGFEGFLAVILIGVILIGVWFWLAVILRRENEKWKRRNLAKRAKSPATVHLFFQYLAGLRPAKYWKRKNQIGAEQVQ